MTTVVDIEFRAQSNISQITAQIEAVNASLKGMNSALRMADSTKVTSAFQAFNNTMSGSGQFMTSLHNIQAAEVSWGKSMNENKLRLRDYNKELGNFINKRETMVRKLARQQLALQNSIVKQVGTDAQGRKIVSVNTPTGVDVSQKAFDAKRVQVLNEVLSKASGKVIDLGKNIQWAGRQMMVGLTIPIGLFGAAAGKAFLDMDAGLVRLQKVYGDLNTNLTTDQIKNLRTEVIGLAKDLAGQYGTSMTDTIALAGDFAATGQQGVDLINSTRAAVRLATLGEVDRAAAMQTTLSLTSAFKIPTKQLGDTVNFLNAVENQTSLTLQDLTEAIPRAGVVVKGLGGDVKDLALYMVAMKEGGVNAAQGANAIKSGLTSIIAPSKKAVEFLKGLNIDLPAIVKANAGDITATIMGLKKALDSLDPLSRQSALAQLFGKYQVARMTALFNNLGADGSQTKKVMELMQASTKQLAAVANREIAQITESVSGKWNRALESMKATLATIGEKFLEVGTVALKAADAILKAFGSMPDWLQNLLTGGAIIAALIGPIVMVSGVLLNFIGTISKMILGIRGASQYLKGNREAFQYLTPEIQAAKLLSDDMTKSFYSQEKAINTVSLAIGNLTKALAEAAGMGESAAAGIAQVGKADISHLIGTNANAQNNWQTTQMGHSIPRPLWNSAKFQNEKGNPYSDGTLRYGLSMGPETYNSNQRNKVPATFFGGPGTAGMKQFDLANSINTAASMEAYQQMINNAKGKAKNALVKLFTDAEVAMNKSVGKVGAASIQAGIQETLVIEAAKLHDLSVAQFREQFGNMFRTAQKALATTVAEVSTMTEAEVMAGLRAAEETLKLEAGFFDQAIKDKITTARDALVVARTSIESSGRLGVSPTTGAKAEVGKASYSGGFAAPLVGVPGTSFATVDQESNIIAKQQKNELNRLKLQDTQSLVIQKESKNQKARSKLGGMGGKIGMAGMGLSMIPMAMNDTGNAALDNGLSIAGGAGMGASIGMMAGPVGALAGAVIGGAIPAVSQLVTKMNELAQVTAAAFSVGEDAANRYGASVLKIQDLNVAMMAKGDKTVLSQVQSIADAMSKAPDGSADKTLVDFIKGEGDINSIMGRMKERAAQLVIAGVKPQDVRNQIAGILTAAGKSQYVTDVNTEINLNMSSPKGALQDQINNAMTKVDGQAAAFRESVAKALGSDNLNGKIEDIRIGVAMEGGPETQKAIEALRASWRGLTDQQKEDASAAGDLGSKLSSVAETLSNAASTMPTQDFLDLANNLQYGALTGRNFADAFGKIPNIGSESAAAMQNLAGQGWETAQMLQGIALVTNGVVSSWQELQSLGPAELTVYYKVYTAEQNVANNVGKSAIDMFTKNAAKARAAGQAHQAAVNKAGGGGGGGGNSAGKAKSDALEKQKKKIQDYYDNEIKKVKEAEKAKQDAAAAEKLRIERQKRDLNSLIDYRTALAAGDFAAAAKIKNEADANKKQDKIDDNLKKNQDATDKRIAALEKERDAKLAAIQKVLDAQNKANSAAASGAKAAGAAGVDATNVAAEKMAQKWEALGQTIQGIMDNTSLSWGQKISAMMEAVKTAGINLAPAVKAALDKIDFPKDFENTGTDIFNTIKKDIASAPWGLVGSIVESAMAGDSAQLARKLRTLKIWMANPKKGAQQNSAATKAAAIDARTGNGPSVSAATGGHIKGPGTWTSDSIPAWLSNGEYVIQARTVAKYGKGFFDKVNAGKFANGGIAIGANAAYHGIAKGLLFSKGGSVNGNMMGSGVSYGDIEVNILQPGATKEEIVQAVFKAIELKEKKKGPQR